MVRGRGSDSLCNRSYRGNRAAVDINQNGDASFDRGWDLTRRLFGTDFSIRDAVSGIVKHDEAEVMFRYAKSLFQTDPWINSWVLPFLNNLSTGILGSGINEAYGK